MAKLVKTEPAKADLLEIWAYVVSDSLEKGERLIDEFDEVMKKLAEYPNMGRKRYEISEGLNSFPAGNYMIYYRERAQGIVVSRVLHTSRDVDAVFE